MSPITQRIKIFIFCSLFASELLIAADVFNKCPASPEYLADLAKYKNTIKIDQDFSCLTDLPSIQQKISHYQLIDIRSTDNVNNYSQIWKLNVNQLKHKDYLQHKKLLLLGDDFSRVKAANDCYNLKKQGFDQIKILVGGFNIWDSYNNKQQYTQTSQRVTARDFIHEFFNGTVIVAVSDKNTATKLSALGIDSYLIETQSLSQKLSDLIINKTMNGYFPLVYIGDTSSLHNAKLHQYPNFYYLEGGFDALQAQLKTDVMTDMSRYDLLNVTACENAQL